MEEAAVRIFMESGTVVNGWVHVPEGRRLSDVMNDDRMFLPVYVLTVEGRPAKLRMIQKQLIETVDEI